MPSSITSIEPIDYADILSISDAQMGVSYITNKNLIRFSERDQILVLRQDQGIAGFITWETEFPKETIPYISNCNSPRIFIKSIVVSANHQKQGIGSKMVNYLLDTFTKHHIMYLGWKANGHCNIERLSLKLGFTNVGEIQKLWQEECESGDFVCPELKCTCECSGIVFEKLT